MSSLFFTTWLRMHGCFVCPCYLLVPTIPGCSCSSVRFVECLCEVLGPVRLLLLSVIRVYNSIFFGVKINWKESLASMLLAVR